MVVSRLAQLTNREHTLLLLGVAFVKGAVRTMPQYQLFTPAWWMILALNLVALPLGWLALYYVAPALGDAVGAGLAVLLIVAVPLAILAVMVWRILVPLVLKRAPWTFLIVGAQIEPEGAATYSVANLFSLAKLPYKLHSLTGTLLE